MWIKVLSVDTKQYLSYIKLKILVMVIGTDNLQYRQIVMNDISFIIMLHVNEH